MVVNGGVGAKPTLAGRPLRCWLPAVLAGWVTMIFVSSALIVLSGVPNAMLLWLGELSRRTVAPVPSPRLSMYALNIASGAAAITLTLALVPAAFSRGFGVGLTGSRFDPGLLLLYLVSSALSAVAYTVSLTRCRIRYARRVSAD
jgi:hypothetical protein